MYSEAYQRVYRKVPEDLEILKIWRIQLKIENPFFLPEPVSVYLRINKVFVSYFYNSCLGNLKHTDRDAGIYEACTPRL